MINNVIKATTSRKIDDCKIISPDLVPLLVNRISNYFNYQQVYSKKRGHTVPVTTSTASSSSATFDTRWLPEHLNTVRVHHKNKAYNAIPLSESCFVLKCKGGANRLLCVYCDCPDKECCRSPGKQCMCGLMGIDCNNVCKRGDNPTNVSEERIELKTHIHPFLYNTFDYNDPELHYIGPDIVEETDILEGVDSSVTADGDPDGDGDGVTVDNDGAGAGSDDDVDDVNRIIPANVSTKLVNITKTSGRGKSKETVYRATGKLIVDEYSNGSAIPPFAQQMSTKRSVVQIHSYSSGEADLSLHLTNKLDQSISYKTYNDLISRGERLPLVIPVLTSDVE